MNMFMKKAARGVILTTLWGHKLDEPDHAVSRCNCQTCSQICRIQFSCSATNYIITRIPVFRGCWPTCMEQTSTTASSRLLS